MLAKIRTYRNVRSRIFRSEANVWLAGWVRNLAQDSATIRLNAFVGLRVGETLSGECYGDGALARFEGRLVSQMGQDVTIRFTTALCYEPSTETIRIRVEGVQGSLDDGTKKFDLMPTDVSPRSLGGYIDRLLVPSTELQATVDTSGGQISFKVRVQNCRASAEQGCFRAGFIIAEIGRLDEARWLKFIDERIAE